MRARELFSNYRQRVEAVAAEQRSLPARSAALNEILRQFEHEASALGTASARLLCEELCDQLEHEALTTTSKYRRDVLMRAIKGLEEISDRSLRPQSVSPRTEERSTERSSRSMVAAGKHVERAKGQA
jgi:hypothetical protein